MIALEHRDEEGQRQERMRPQLEQPRIVVRRQRLPLDVVEAQPGGRLAAVTAEDAVGVLALPPLHRGARLLAVALDQLGIAVHGEQELVQQVLAHAPAPPSGYQVKYASMVWNRS